MASCFFLEHRDSQADIRGGLIGAVRHCTTKFETIRRWIYILLGAGLFFCLSACGNSVRHCFLCQSMAYDAPCVVNLGTGDITELSIAELHTAITWRFSGDIRVAEKPELTQADIPGVPQNVNTGLFCDHCLAAIEQTPNHGYVLADLHDLDDIRLFPIQGEQSLDIRSYEITLIDGEDSETHVLVKNK